MAITGASYGLAPEHAFNTVVTPLPFRQGAQFRMNRRLTGCPLTIANAQVTVC
jgi:hypothetical protein